MLTMENNDIPVRATTFLRDPSTGLAQNGVYDIDQESKNRSIIISSRIELKKKRESEQEFKSSQLLTWNIYTKYLNKKYIENLRFNNELRREFSEFISLISKYLLSDSFTTNEVSSTTYFILRAIYRIYKQKQLTKYNDNDKKINKFIANIRNDITKYFNKLSDKSWNELYNIGVKLLYFLSTENDDGNNNQSSKAKNQDLSKLLKELTADHCDFDYNSVKLFSKDASVHNDDNNKDEYKLNKREYGNDIEFHDPLIARNELLLPQMTSLERKQFSMENHRPSESSRFTNKKVTKGNNKQTNGNNGKQQSKPNKSKPKQPKIDKFTVEWIREKAQYVAMMKLQVFYAKTLYISLHSMNIFLVLI